MRLPRVDRVRSRQALGRDAERAAAAFLTRRGYRIERANVRFRVGEIDLVAWDRSTLCFVEVRSASSTAWGGAAASVDAAKRRHLIRAAQCYAAGLRQLPEQMRFDVVTVQWSADRRPSVEVIRGAFEAG